MTDNEYSDNWKKNLTPEQYKVLREKGTEPPFSGKYLHHKEKGVYKCVVCGNELFSSKTKFDSGTGWPSFSDPMNKENLLLEEDLSLGMKRTEVKCKKCGSHLGHVFPDLPAPYTSLTRKHLAGGRQAGGHSTSGNRYCINSVCLVHEKDKQ